MSHYTFGDLFATETKILSRVRDTSLHKKTIPNT